MKTKYPKMNCGPVTDEYDKRREAWMRDSIMEYKTNVLMEEKGGTPMFTGPM